MVIMGISASAVVSVLLFPVSARKDVREDLRKATDALGDMMKIVTDSFLYGTEEELKGSTYRQVQAKYKSIFTSVKKNLREAKYEHYILGTEKQYRALSRLTKCLESLALDINGLRSAATTQFGLIDKPAVGARSPQNDSTFSSPTATKHLSQPLDMSRFERRVMSLASIDEEIDDSSREGDIVQSPTTMEQPDSGNTNGNYNIPNGAKSAITPADMFSVFIEHLGPPMVRSPCRSLK